MARVGFLMLICFFLCLLQTPATAQNVFNTNRDTVFFTSNRTKIHLPFNLVHNLIVLPIQINGSKPLNFILDSGVKNTLITHLYHEDSLDLNDVNKITINGLGEGHSIEAYESYGNEMFMRGIKGINHLVYVLLEDVFDLSSYMGMPVHGIIGYDIFKNFIVKIDYSNRMLTLYRPDTVLKKKRKAEQHPLYIEGTKAYVYGNVRQHNGDTVKVKLVVDTGASNSLSLYLPTDKRLSLPPKVMKAFLGRGLSGDLHGNIGRLDAFALGKYELENLPASYPDEESIKLALNMGGRNGNLGSDILSRFTVIFDYPHSQLTLIPNRRFKEPFNHNMAGFEVITPLPGTNFYVISNVVEGSPAKMLGLEPGDQLLDINGRKCTDLLLPELMEILKSKSGRTLRLRLKRQQEILNVDLVLQSRI